MKVKAQLLVALLPGVAMEAVDLESIRDKSTKWRSFVAEGLED